MRSWTAYALVLATVLLTVFGQFVLKWQVTKAGGLPESLYDKAFYVVRLLLNPWVVAAFAAAFGAAIAWIMALSKLPLSHAYPMTALTFVLVVLGSAVMLNEPVTPLKAAGLLLIILGIIVGSQG